MPNSAYASTLPGTNDWTNSTNGYGAADGSCATDAGNAAVVQYGFGTSFNGIPDSTVIDGIEVDVWWSSSDNDEDIVVSIITGQGTAPTTYTLTSGGRNTNCSGVVQETEGGSTNLWGESSIAGSDISGTDELQVQLTHNKAAKGGTVYVDAVRVTLHYIIKLELDAGIGINATAPKTVKKALDAGIGISAEAEDYNSTWATVTHYVRTGGSSGDWTSGSNVEGEHSGTCMSSTSNGDEQICLIEPFYEIPLRARIIGVEVTLHMALDTGSDWIDVLIQTNRHNDTEKIKAYPEAGATSCATATDVSVGGTKYIWDSSIYSSSLWPDQQNVWWGDMIRNDDFSVVLTHAGGSNTMYVDCISVSVTFEFETNSASQYIKSGGVIGDWTNGSNAEGAPDNSCASSSTGSDTLVGVPVQFTVIDDDAIVHGIKTTVECAASTVDQEDMEIYLGCDSLGYSDTKSTELTDIPYGTTCADSDAITIGGPADLWGYGPVVGSDINGTDFKFYITHTTGTATAYIDSVQVTVYYSDKTPTKTTKNIKTGGSSGGWTNDANAEGAADGSCMTSSSDGNSNACYPDQFSALGDGDRIQGIEVRVKRSCDTSGTDNLLLNLSCDYKGDSVVKAGANITDTSDCTAVAWESFGGPDDMWEWGKTIGLWLNGTDFHVDVEHNGSNTVYVDAIEVIIYSHTVSSVSKWIKSGGATGDFTNDSNMEGSPDGSCATATYGVPQDQETCYPEQFSTIPNDAAIYGIYFESIVASTSDETDHIYMFEVNCTDLGSLDNTNDEVDSYVISHTTTCADADSEFLGMPDWLPWDEVVVGSALNDGSLYFVVQYNSGSGTVYFDAIKTTIYYESTGVLHQVYPTAGVGINAAYLKSLTKALDAGVGISGDETKSLTKTLAAGIGINASAILTKTKQLLLDIGIGISSVTSKSLKKVVSAGVGVSGTVKKNITKKLSAGVGISATYLKSLKKVLAANVGINAAATLARTAYLNLAAGVGISATKVKNITKALSAGLGISATATALRIKYLFLDAGIGINSAVSKTIKKVLAAGVGINAVATAFKTTYLYLAANVGISATKVKNITKAVAAAIGINAAATTLRTAYINAAAGIGIGATKVKNITKALAAGLGINAAAEATVAIFLYLNAGIGISATYAKSLTKALAAGIGISAQKVKNITKVLSAGVGINASTILTKTKQLLLDIGIGISSTTSKSIKKVLAAGLGINAAVSTLRTAYLNLAAGVGISVTKVKSVTKALAAGIGVSATKLKSIAKALAIGIGINAVGIATKIGGVIKYIYAGAGVGINAARKKSITKVLAIGVGISAAGSALRTAYLALSAGIGISAAVSTARTAYLYLSGGIGIGVAKTKSLTKKLAAGLGINSTAPKTLGKKVSAGVGISVVKVKNITKRMSAGVGISVTKVKNVIKRLLAGIGITSLAWRPRYPWLTASLAMDDRLKATVSKTMTQGKDCITDGLTIVADYPDPGDYQVQYNGPEWYEGFWNSGLVDMFDGTWALNTTEKTAGTHSLELDGGTKDWHSWWYEFAEAEIFVGGVDFTKYDGFRFDMKLPVLDSHYDYIILSDYDIWWVYYEGYTDSKYEWAEDGEWHTYEIWFNDYTDIDDPDEFHWDGIWAIEIYAGHGETGEKAYIDNFEFFRAGDLKVATTQPDRLKADLEMNTSENLDVTLSTPQRLKATAELKDE
jgi:DNA-binding Lrp family transcriptional regulator